MGRLRVRLLLSRFLTEGRRGISGCEDHQWRSVQAFFGALGEKT